MKKETRHKRILILMISSQLLLTGFVIQWLFSQYREEKGLLAKELTGFYLKSHDEVLDTLLFKTYIDPVLSENRIIMMDHRIIRSDSAEEKVITLSKSSANKSGLGMNDSAVVTVNIKHGKNSEGKSTTLVKRKGLPEDMLLKSIKLIIAHTGDTVNIDNPETEFSSAIDTSKFKKSFYQRINKNGMNFHIDWIATGTEIIQAKARETMVIEPLPVFSLPAAAVTGYHGYLIARMMTQIIFGIVLVLITALAFIVAYRSLRNHMIMNSLRDEFVSNITHELKTPVSTIMVALEALGNFNMKKEPKVMEEYLRLASEETHRLGELINRVLDHTLLEQKQHPLDLKEVDLNRLISEVVNIMSIKLGKKGSIEFNPGEEYIGISGDPLYLKGVFINLIDNSIKYCDKEPVIKIAASHNDKETIIEINDNGPGIPAEYQKKIFEKFFRLPSEDVHNVKGYGLGLSFASLVMELHHGSIEVRNLSPGSSFILKFPSDQ
jgi:signal transduction histidine kinase